MIRIIRRYWATAQSSLIVRRMGWNVLGSMSVVLLTPIITIVAARLLSPEDYGAFGVAMAVMALLQLGRDFGLSQAVIVSEKNEDFRNLQFTVQLLWGGLLFLLLLIGAPLLAGFYHSAELNYVLPLLGVSLLLNAITDPLQTAYLKAQNYRFLFFRQIVPTLIKGVVLIALAYGGGGVYALVAGVISGALADAVLLFWRSAWRPRLHFDWHQFQVLFRLGKHQVFQEFCGYLVLKADALIVGKNLGMTNLGIYQMGNNLANIVPNAVTPQVAQVVFTDLARHKGDVAYLNRRYYQFVYWVGLVALVFSVMLYFMAKPLILFLLGEKWGGGAIVMQAFSLIIPLVPLSILNIQISRIYGFNHAYSYFALGRGLLTVSLVMIASFYSLSMVLQVWVVSGILGATINSLVFFRYQTMVRVRGKFIALFGICFLWAGLGLASLLVSW